MPIILLLPLGNVRAEDLKLENAIDDCQIEPLGIIDTEPPELIGGELEKTEVEVPGTIVATLTGSDDISRLEDGRLVYLNSLDNKKINVYLSGNRFYDEEEREYIDLSEGILKGTLKLDQYQLPGLLELISVDLYDKAGNHQRYVKDRTDYEIAEGYKELTIESSILVINDGGGYELTTNTANPNLADDIKNIDSPADGEPPVRIGINYETGSNIPEEVFGAIVGQNKELVFEGGSVQWVFNGKDIQSDKPKPIDLAVKINNLKNFYDGNANEIKEQVNKKPTYVLSFPNNMVNLQKQNWKKYSKIRIY